MKHLQPPVPLSRYEKRQLSREKFTYLSCVTLFDHTSVGCKAMSKLKISYDRTGSDEDQ